ncbi:MAG: hypothetical protein KAG66_10740, partial [Methylococcales bacterium]|nr:hypothetical protein [Methylococcales bacterium]
PALSNDGATQDRVARVAARHLGMALESDMVLGVAWGEMVNKAVSHLIPKPLVNVRVVQLNGGENVFRLGHYYAGNLFTQLADNFGAEAHLFPVPRYFDYAETKEVLWRERRIQHVLQLQHKADVLLYGVGDVYVEEGEDVAELQAVGVVGEIANIMIREDGEYADVIFNQRACGPELSLFKEVDRVICVVSGVGKMPALRAALVGGYMTDLIIDEPTARQLVNSLSD